MQIITSILITFQYIVAVASIANAIYVFTRWGQQRMMYFAILALVIAFQALGYLFEITSEDLPAAINAVKVQYLGSPLIGVLFYCFARDYVNRPKLSAITRIILFGISAVFVLLVLLYPYEHLYYANLGFVTPLTSAEDVVSHLIVSPGLFYYPCLLWQFALVSLGTFVLVRGFVREKCGKATVAFIIAASLPMLSQIARFANLIPGNWNPVPTALVVSAILFSWYLAKFRREEWQSTGREIVVENMYDGYILLDAKMQLLDYNSAARKYFPKLSQAKKGSNIAKIEKFPIEIFTNCGEIEFDHEVDNQNYHLRLNVSSLEVGEVHTGTSLIIYDITENYKMMQALNRLARHDELTGLYNRATFFREATRSFNLIQRTEGMNACALMMDIDLFKKVNDTYGHLVGDEVLSFIGKILNERFRDTDICGRYGGEELCVWLPSTDLEGAKKVAEEICILVREKVFETKWQKFSITISIGIAGVPSSNSANFEDLMRKADEALYDAKNSGRDKVCMYQQDRIP